MSRRYDFFAWKREQLGVALRTGRIDEGDYTLACVLDEYDQGGGVWPSQATLADRMHCSSRTAKRRFDKLVAAGLIAGELRPGKSTMVTLGLPLTLVTGVGETNTEQSDGPPLTGVSGDPRHQCQDSPDTNDSRISGKKQREGRSVDSLRECTPRGARTLHPSLSWMHDYWWNLEQGIWSKIVAVEDKTLLRQIVQLVQVVEHIDAPGVVTSTEGLLRKARENAQAAVENRTNSAEAPWLFADSLKAALVGMAAKYNGSQKYLVVRCRGRCDPDELGTPAPRSACRCPGVRPLNDPARGGEPVDQPDGWAAPGLAEEGSEVGR